MNRRLVFALLVLLLVLAGVYLWQQQPAPQPESTVHQLGELLGFNVTDIQAIRLRDLTNQQELMIARDASGAWNAPEEAGRLDPSAADIISKTLTLIPFNETITINSETDLSQYGFQPDGRFSIEILLSDGTGHVIAIGKATPSLRLSYALIDQRPLVFLLLRDPIEYLNKQVTTPPMVSQ